MQIFAGVDRHKDSHVIVFIGENGRVLREMSISTTSAGYAAAISAAAVLGLVKWGVEGTGVYGRGFANALLAAGSTVYEVPGALTKRHRKHSSQHGKSDRIDALAIAEAVLREADRLPLFREFAEQEALRLRYDQRDRLVRERTAIVNRLRSQALRLGLAAVHDRIARKNPLQAFKQKLALVKASEIVQEALLDELTYDCGRLDWTYGRHTQYAGRECVRNAHGHGSDSVVERQECECTNQYRGKSPAESVTLRDRSCAAAFPHASWTDVLRSKMCRRQDTEGRNAIA